MIGLDRVGLDSVTVSQSELRWMFLTSFLMHQEDKTLSIWKKMDLDAQFVKTTTQPQLNQPKQNSQQINKSWGLHLPPLSQELYF